MVLDGPKVLISDRCIFGHNGKKVGRTLLPGLTASVCHTKLLNADSLTHK